MSTILQPSPRAPQHIDIPRFHLTPPRLMSPISLNEPFFPLKSRSPTPCNTNVRRRNNTRAVRAVRRRRSSRIDSSFDPFASANLTSLDRLPWIHSLDAPSLSSAFDIADLSQISVGEQQQLAMCPDPEPAGPGPVRRRKTSLRSNPLATPADIPSESSPSRYLSSHISLDPLYALPSTPPPRTVLDPSRIVFHDLMPVLPSHHNTTAPAPPRHSDTI